MLRTLMYLSSKVFVIFETVRLRVVARKRFADLVMLWRVPEESSK